MTKQFIMERSWYERLKEEFEQPYMKKLQTFLSEEFSKGKIVYPKQENIFNAFCQTTFNNVKVVVVGQDPYHGPDQAHGLSFSVQENIPLPPSLQNIYKELQKDEGITMPTSGCLIPWAKQGVFLLNATLTVEANSPRSHYGFGWEKFTDKVIEVLAQREDPLVFLLWGKSAQEKCKHVLSHHLVLSAPHPSPFSVHSGFFGCKHFSKTNEFLKNANKKPINWQI